MPNALLPPYIVSRPTGMGLSDKNWCNLPEATALSREDAFQMGRRTAVHTASLSPPEYSARYPSLCMWSEQNELPIITLD